jgi:hypothetical protein
MTARGERLRPCRNPDYRGEMRSWTFLQSYSATVYASSSEWSARCSIGIRKSNGQTRRRSQRAGNLALDGGGVMRSMRFERPARWVTGALMVLLVHGLGAPRPAWAGCNHRIVSKSDRALDFNRLDALIVGGSSTASSDALARDPLKEQGPNRPTPCSGPGCSSQVPAPIPTAIPNTDRSDQWGNLSSPAIHPIGSPPSRTIHEPVGRPTGQKPSIFHPPPA